MEKRRGRPRRTDARRKKVGFKVSDEERIRLEQIARHNSKNLSDFIREACESAAAESSDIQILRPSA